MTVLIASEPVPGLPNQDYAVGSPNAAVVIDGAGTPAELPTGCIHGTAWYARQLGTELHRSAVNGTDSLENCLSEAIERTAHLHTGTCDLGDPMTPSATVAVCRADGQHLDWLVLCDATLVLDSADGPQAVSDHRVSEVTRKQRREMADALESLSPTRRFHALVRAQREMMNVQEGYWVAAADPKAAREAITGTIPLTELSLAVLLTDGAARAVDDFRVMDWVDVVALLVSDGPSALLARTRELESSDPDRKRWPRNKKHDDASVAVFHPDRATDRTGPSRHAPPR